MIDGSLLATIAGAGAREAHVAHFWSKVDMSAGPRGCWPWLAYTTPKGYGCHNAGRILGGRKWRDFDPTNIPLIRAKEGRQDAR